VPAASCPRRRARGVVPVAPRATAVYHVPAMTLREIFGLELPIIQAPMAGVQGSDLAVAVSNAGGLGSLPCALISLDTMRTELAAIRSKTHKPFNVNFFCHTTPVFDGGRDAAWRTLLAPYYKQYGLDMPSAPAGQSRAPFSPEAADVLEHFRPPIVSFHFGLPSAELMVRVKSWGSKVLASATTVAEARWLEERGVSCRRI
jgi:nitronate monooxygenase